MNRQRWEMMMWWWWWCCGWINYPNLFIIHLWKMNRKKIRKCVHNHATSTARIQSSENFFLYWNKTTMIESASIKENLHFMHCNSSVFFGFVFEYSTILNKLSTLNMCVCSHRMMTRLHLFSFQCDCVTTVRGVYNVSSIH